MPNKSTSQQLTNLLLQTIELAKDVIIITEAYPVDPPGPRIVYVNKSFEELTGYSRDEVIGLTPRILQGKETSSKVLARIGKSIRNHKTIHEAIINYTKFGKKYWLDLSIVPLYDEKNNITHFAAIERDICKIKKLEKKLKKIATLDYLTGILNRRAFFEITQHHLELFFRDKIPFSMLMIDIDDFKKINDTYGHIAGDNTLQWLGKNLKTLFRKSDLLGRYGGEEFIILLPATSLAQATEKALAINQYIDHAHIRMAASFDIHITISIGVVEVNMDDISLLHLFDRADKLLYQAKNNKKNCVAWA